MHQGVDGSKSQRFESRKQLNSKVSFTGSHDLTISLVGFLPDIIKKGSLYLVISFDLTISVTGSFYLAIYMTFTL